ncbi:MAG: beta-propeller fold lactonase family protein, partial [Planctomycetes bacterium]|nr:beta-propeller fold lactonase family protein [Planctomycetota bacterium]
SNFCSEILISADGRFVYAGNRLHDSIGILSVGANGDLTYIGEEWTRGDYPRSFAFDPTGRFLYCCNQRADNVTVFRADRETGNLAFTGQYTPVGNPSSIVFLDLEAPVHRSDAPSVPDGGPSDRRLHAVETATPRIIALVFVDRDENPPPSQAPDDYRVNGRAPERVGRYSATLYEERCTDWRAQRYPQILGHRIYLVLDARLEEGREYRIEFPGGRTTFTFHAADIPCESFRVNQVGYHPLGGRRAAFFAPWCGDLGPRTDGIEPEVVLCNAETGRGLGAIRMQRLPEDPLAGGPVYRIDLTRVAETGLYYLKMAGAGRSPSFGFGDACAHHAFYAHMKGFYHQRCGQALTRPYTEWERPACHTSIEVTDADPPDFIRIHGPRRSRPPGGHHDAGDFDVRLPHTLVAGWLLNAYELCPGKFTDGQLDIPESGNGIPDILDEALFSIWAWEDLQEADGGIRAGFEADRHPTYGEVNAATDKLVYRTYRRDAHATLAGGALMAYAARLVEPFDAARAAGLLAGAEKAWGFFERHRDDPAYRWSTGARLFASAQLYLATARTTYHDVFKREAAEIFELDGRKSAWPAQYHGTYFNLDTIAKGAVFTHYFAGYLFAKGLDRDERIVAAARAAVIRKADEQRKGMSPDGFATLSTAGWGASTGVGRYGDFLIHAWRLTGEDEYRDAAARLADWALGANPVGWCFTTGLGSRPPYNPLHLDSYVHLSEGLGPAPGIVIYGVTGPPGGSPYVKAVTQHLHPSMDELPPARRVTDGWSVVAQNEFTVWETMAPNAFLHACLAPEKPLRGRLLPWSGVRLPGGYPAPIRGGRTRRTPSPGSPPLPRAGAARRRS